MLRLRAHDRRTTTLAIDFMPPAYKAACDLVIREEEFIEEALGQAVEGNVSGGIVSRARVPVAVLKAMAARVYAVVCEEGEVAGADLPDILKDFREFRDSNNWLGFGTSQRLAEALISSETRLQVARVNALMYKLVLKPTLPTANPVPANLAPVEEMSPAFVPPMSPVGHPLQGDRNGAPARRSGRPARPVEPVSAAAADSDERPDKIDLVGLREQVVALVRELVQGSETPVLLARASQHVVSKLGHQVLTTQWAGAGTFKKLLQTVRGLGLEITTQPEPGYLFDPRRHANPSRRGQAEAAEGTLATEEADENQVEAVFEPVEAEQSPYPQEPASRVYAEEDADDEDGEEEYEESLPSLEEFVRRVGQVTGAPELPPEQYALVFHGLVAELQQIAAEEKGYNTYQSSKAISDWCAERGVAISRGDVALILKGIIFQDGIRFSKRPGSYTAQELAVIVRKNIQALCRRSRLEISEFEERLLDEWILGGLEEEENVAASQPAGSEENTFEENTLPPEG